MSARVLITIPIYNGRAALAACLERFLNTPIATPYRLLLIDDASSDTEVSALARRHARNGDAGAAIEYRRNAENRGFTATINQALRARRPGEHFLMLNADTLVTPGWLDQMLASAAEDDGSGRPVGTVTPFSNNATICSFPDFSRAWPLPSREEQMQIARLLAAEPVAAIDIPTGVGFCMLITAACLDAVGAFDERNFPRGYGEENDFCRRAAKAGFRNVLCPNAWVGHVGGVSFAEEREALMRAGGERLLALHPDYNDLVQDWIARDPAQARRAWLSARLATG